MKGSNQTAMKKKKMASENHLKEFSYYFLLFVENALTKWKKYLDGDPDDIETSMPGNILARVVSEIPVGGSHLSDAVSCADKWRQNRRESTKAKKMFNIIHFFENEWDDFKKILIEGAFDIFYIYQQQFSLVSCEEGTLRAMQKLGMDASQRFLNFVIDSDDIDKLTKDVVVKGVVLGKSNKHQKNFFVKGKKLEIIGSKREIRTKDVFERVSVRIGRTIYSDEKYIKELGYREKFPWEDTSNFKFVLAFEPYTFSSKYYMNIKDKEEYLKIVAGYITTKNTFDDMKEYIHQELENVKSQSIDISAENREMIVNMTENLSNMHHEISNERTKSEQRINQLIEETERAKKYCVLRVYNAPVHADLHYCTPQYHFHPISVA